MSSHPIFGGRKGPSAPPAPPPPVQTPDNLRSDDKVEVLLGLCEGPIQGLVDGSKSFYIGETTLVNANNEDNFQDFSLTEYDGDSPASEIKLTLGGTTRSTNVGVTLFSGTPVVRQTLFGDIDYIDVRILISRLYRSDDTGVYNHSITFNIEYKALSAGIWNDAFPDHDITIHGKTTSNYAKEFRFPVARIQEPYEIRVTKVSPESNTTTSFRDMAWESFQEVDAEVRSYDDLAMVHLVGRASDQFSSIPDFKGEYELLKFRVPTNYNPTTRVYTGVWDGTYQIAYSNNPAWFLNEYLLNDRFGMSAYYPVVTDKWDFYECAQWCDEMVPDGKGGTHPRWTLNMIIQDPRPGKELAKYIAGTFNAVFFDDLNGTAKLKVDKDDDAIHLFTTENVIDGKFSYSYTDLSSRYNDIIVAFTNPDLNWQEDRRRVFDQNDIDLNGRIPLDFVAIGCTNEQEALRRGTYKLITSLTEKEMVTFRTNRVGQYVQPWDVMLVGDEDQGYSLTGRALSVSGDNLTITLRDPIYLETGINYTLRAFHHAVIPDAGYPSGFAPGLFERTVNVGVTGTVTQITVDLALPTGMPDYFTFSLEQTGAGYGAPKPYRVIYVDEVDGEADLFEIHGMEINRNKHYDVDNLTSSGTISYSTLPTPFIIPGPTSVAFQEGYFRGTREFQLIVDPLFDKVAYPYYNGEFDVYSRPDDESEGWQKWSLRDGDTIVGHPEGLYQFRVTPRNFLGATAKLEEMTSFVYNVSYVVPLPANVQNFRHEIDYNGLVLRWDKNTEPDLDFYEIREGTSWANGELVVTNQTGNYFIVPKKKIGEVTYQIAAVAGGVYSNPAPLTLNLVAPVAVKNFRVIQNNEMLVFTWDQNPEPDLADYVIREGLTWGSGVTMAEVNSTRWTTPSNLIADRHFWIKARDKSGNLSEKSTQVVVTVKPTDHYNYLVTQDEKTGGWTGELIYASIEASNLTLPANVPYGEYLYEINLASSQYARNLLLMDVDAVTSTGLTWQTATFAWNAPQAAIPWVVSGDLDAVGFTQMIAIEVTPSVGEFGFRLNDTLVGNPTNNPVNSNGYTNKLLRSEELDNASWNKPIATVTANAINDSDGNLTADKLNTVAVSGWQSAYQNVTITGGATVTMSAEFKAGEYDGCWLMVGDVGTSWYFYARFRNGAIVGSGAIGSGTPDPAEFLGYTIEDKGNGWYRYSITGKVNHSGDTSVAGRVAILNASNQTTFIGDGGGGYFAKMQLVQDSVPRPYLKTTTTTVSGNDLVYQQGRFANGLTIQPGMNVSWNVTMASTFAMDFWLRMKDLVNDYGVLTLSGAGGISLALTYEGSVNEFVLTDDEAAEVRLSGPVNMSVDDLVYVTIVQTATDRKLFLGHLQDNEVLSAVSTLAPQGVFNSVSII